MQLQLVVVDEASSDAIRLVFENLPPAAAEIVTGGQQRVADVPVVILLLVISVVCHNLALESVQNNRPLVHGDGNQDCLRCVMSSYKICQKDIRD